MALLETTETGSRKPTSNRKRSTGRWQLDERTRELGKRGVAAAREALAEAAGRRTAA